MNDFIYGGRIDRFGSVFRRVLLGAALVTTGATFGENGVTKNEIVLGTTTNLRGKTAGIAVEFNDGLTAYFNKINKSGGVYGRKIRRIIYNDSYEPDLTVNETKRLIHRDKVFALIGYASTPGAKAIIPLITTDKVPLIAPYSGANFLRAPNQKYIFNIKSGYTDQTETLVKLGTYSMGIKSICTFYQNDELGNEANTAAQDSLQKYNINLIAQADYKRNSMDIQPALKKLKAAGCKAIIMAAQDRQTTAFVKAANASGFHPLYLCLSLIGTDEFLKSVAPLNERIYVAVVVPLPSETAYPLVKEFRKDVVSLNPHAKFTSSTLEGYLVGAIFEEALKKAGKNPTRASFGAAFESLNDTKIGGIFLTFNKANRQATNRVLVTKAEGNELVLLP